MEQPYTLEIYEHGVRIIGPAIEGCLMSYEQAREILRVLNATYDRWPGRHIPAAEAAMELGEDE